MNTECLERLVSLKGCETAETRYTLNQAGLSVKQIAELMDDSYATEEEFVEAMKKFAAEKLVSDVVAFLSKTGTTFSRLESGSVAEPILDTPKVVSGWAGVKIRVEATGENLRLVFPRIGFFAAADAVVKVKVVNLWRGEELDEVEVDAKAGKVVWSATDVSIPVGGRGGEFALIYDGAGSVSANATKVMGGSCRKCGIGWVGGGLVSRRGGTFADASGTGYQSGDTTSGLLVDYTVYCDMAATVCEIGDVIGLAYLYRVVEQIFEFGLKSGGQFSNQKTTNYKRNEDRYKHAQWSYMNEMEKVFATSVMREGLCWKCRTSTRVLTKMPR